MRRTLSLALIGSFLLPSLPLAAQVPPPSFPQIANWSRVRTISAGAPIHVAYVGRRKGHQYFVSATDEQLVILMPDHLPRSARHALIEIAETQPGFFTATKWMEFTTGSVRVNPDGIWVKSHRIAGLEDFVATVDRGEVAEVSRDIFVRRPRPMIAPAQVDPETGAAVMSGAGTFLLTAAACKGRCSEWVLAAAFVGPMIAVAVLLARHRDRDTELVYRAP